MRHAALNRTLSASVEGRKIVAYYSPPLFLGLSLSLKEGTDKEHTVTPIVTYPMWDCDEARLLDATKDVSFEILLEVLRSKPASLEDLYGILETFRIPKENS